MISQSRNVPSGSPGRYDHLVCNSGFAFEGNDEQLFSFVVFKCLDNCACQRVDIFNCGRGGGKRPL
jgi:hypothetical protein